MHVISHVSRTGRKKKCAYSLRRVRKSHAYTNADPHGVRKSDQTRSRVYVRLQETLMIMRLSLQKHRRRRPEINMTLEFPQSVNTHTPKQ